MLEEMREGKMIEFNQYDFEVPEILKANFAQNPPFVKNIFVNKNNTGDLVKIYEPKEKQ